MAAKKPMASQPTKPKKQTHTPQNEKTLQELAAAQIRAVFNDNKATINGTEYVFGSFVHKQRRKVFAFYSGIATTIEKNDFSFLEDDRLDEIEEMICHNTLVDGLQISKTQGYWEEHPEDYLSFIILAMQVISYPFMKGGNGK